MVFKNINSEKDIAFILFCDVLREFKNIRNIFLALYPANCAETESPLPLGVS